MSYAYITSEGQILEICPRPSPFRPLSSGERWVKYTPPEVDYELFSVTADSPVPAEAEEVTFTVTPLAGAAEKILSKHLASVDADVDDIYAKAIGNRGPEYTQAEEQALLFKDSGYTLDPVPDYVASWALASGMSPQAAADSILLQAQQWRAAASAIRSARLAAKAGLRAGTPAALENWKAFVLQIKSVLGI